MNATPLFTIGYSRFSIENFIATLKKDGIDALVDVRALPHVSNFESYKRDNLKKELSRHGIVYKFFGKILGARPDHPRFYTGRKVDFEKIKASPEFQDTCRNLITGMEKGFTICLMCAQNDPIICHRSILITRYFNQEYPQVPIWHILPDRLESQAELDQRVLKLYRDGVYRDSLLGAPSGPGDEMENAYRWQGSQIAYVLDK